MSHVRCHKGRNRNPNLEHKPIKNKSTYKTHKTHHEKPDTPFLAGLVILPGLPINEIGYQQHNRDTHYCESDVDQVCRRNGTG